MMAFRRRGQGSVEFLMTYGWVILAVAVVLVVMWQWGLFSFANYVEPGSFGFWGIVVQNGQEFVFDGSGNLQLSVLNTVGANITVLAVNVNIMGQTVECDAAAGDPCVLVPSVDVEAPVDWGTTNNVIPAGRTRRISVSDNTHWIGRPGSRFDAQIVIQYNDSRTGPHVYQSSGNLWGNIEG